MEIPNIEERIALILKKHKIINACVGIRKSDNSVDKCKKVNLDGTWYVIHNQGTLNYLRTYTRLSGDICEDCFKKQMEYS